MAGTTTTTVDPGERALAADLIWEPFVHGAEGAAPVDAAQERVPVLAPATTASPMRLDRLFPRRVGPVPVTRLILRGFATVYEAHVGPTGVLGATLVGCPPAATSVLLLWLTEPQLAHLRELEAADDRAIGEIGLGEVEIEGVPVERAWLPASASGPLRAGALPVRAAEVPTIGCVYPALTMRAALRYLHRRIGVDEPFETFVEALARDPAARAAFNARLREEPTAA